MITPERVYEVFGITPGPWRVGRYGGVYPDYKTEHGGPGIVSALTKSGYLPNNETNEKLCSASPEMLAALISMVLEVERMFNPKKLKNDDPYFSSIKAIESVDSQNRSWPELKKELEE